MSWIAANGSTIVVLLILIAVVFLIVRSMVKKRGTGCDSCSSGCSCSKSACCPSESFELTDEQKARLKSMRQ